MTRPGREIVIESDNEAFDTYLGTPVAGRRPGLVPQIRDVCDRLAGAGFVALAPDLHRGESTTDPDEAGRLMMALELERASRDLADSVESLRRQPGTEGSRVGCLGFCVGGQLALRAACLVSEIGAVVDCYGVDPNVELDFSACRAWPDVFDAEAAALAWRNVEALLLAELS